MIFSRMYAWLAGVAALVGFIVSVYVRGRKDADNSKMRDAHRRLKDAIEADTRGRERLARGELLRDDGHRRD